MLLISETYDGTFSLVEVALNTWQAFDGILVKVSPPKAGSIIAFGIFPEPH